MGKLKGFLEHNRTTPAYRPVEERVNDFNDVCEKLTDNEVCNQASRCMDCGIPFCHLMGCPTNNLIPEWNDYIYREQWSDALKRLERTNNFPEITGRICPAPCEAACTLAINDSPVTIRQNELTIAEMAFSRGAIKPRIPLNKTGQRVAIIGSGPAGLAAAQQLARLGHMVVILEKDKKPGGILRYGIPNFKLEKWVIDRRLEQMKQEGVIFETDVNVGVDISAHYLKKYFDSVVLTCGSESPRDLTVPGRELGGVHFAMEYLSNANMYLSADTPIETILTARNKNVLVIGGGDTGSDCVGTANRQGANKVYQFEILPKPLEWKESWNPEWPEWPNILRTSSSHEEGCERKWSVLTKAFAGKDGKVKRADCIEVEWKNKKGKTELCEKKGSEYNINVDMVLLAMGFTGIKENKLFNDLNIQMTDKNTFKVDKNYMTTEPGVFAAGDAVTGPSLVVRAIHQGREAASNVHKSLVAKQKNK
jgi:glutamate synthase (NADPH/NADH) small chain